MDNINDFAIHFSINGFAASFLQILVIVICIVIIVKRPKSIGAKILLLGSVLNLLSLLGYSFLPFLTSQEDTAAVMKSQIIQSYFGTFAFFVFVVGFLLFAINDLKKD